MARGWNYHHNGELDVVEFDGQIKIDLPSVTSTTDTLAGLYIDATDNDVHGAYIYSDQASQTSNRALVLVRADNSSYSEQVLEVDNDGTGSGIFINQDGNGIALNIDSEATSADAINIDAVNTSGTVVDINLTAGSTSTANCLAINANSNVSGSKALIILQHDGVNASGIDMTAFTSGSDFLFKIPGDTAAPSTTGTVSGATGRISVQDQYGNVKYIPLYS